MRWNPIRAFWRLLTRRLSLQTGFFAAGVIVLTVGLGLLWYKGAGHPYTARNFSYSADIIASDDLYDQSTQRYLGQRYSDGRFYIQVVSQHGEQLTVRTALAIHALSGQALAGIDAQRSISTGTGQFTNRTGEQSGDYLFAPDNLSAGQDFNGSYVLYNQPARARYLDKETMYGLRLYHYQLDYSNNSNLMAQGIPTANVGADNKVVFHPNVQLWVEPTTGWLIKIADNTKAVVVNAQTGKVVRPYDAFSARYTDASIQQQVAYAANLKHQAVFAKRVAPSFLCVLLLALVFWIGVKRLRVTQSFVGTIFGLWGTMIIIVLAGWEFRYLPFISVFVGGAGVNPVVALDFAIVLLCVVRLYTNAPRRLTMLLGFVLIVANLVALLGLLQTIGFRLDEVVAQATIQNLTEILPSQMSIHDAGMFSLLGVSICLIAYRRNPVSRRLSGFIASIVVVFNVFCLLVQFLQINDLFSINLLYPLSFAASLMFCFAGYLLLVAILRFQPSIALTNERILRRLLRPALLVLPLLVAVIVVQFRQNIAAEELRASFMRRTTIVSSQLTDRAHVYEATLLGTQALFAASHSVEESEWQAFVSDYTQNSFTKGIESIGYAPVVMPADASKYNATMQAANDHSFIIFPQTNDPVLTPVQYVAPQTPMTAKQVGYDLSSNAVIASTLDQASRTDNGVITDALQLGELPGAKRQVGFIMVQPVYLHNMPLATVAERQAATEGYVFAVIDMNDLVESAVGGEYPTIDFQVYNGYVTDPEQLLYDTRRGYTAGSYMPSLSQSSTLSVLGQPWTISYEGTPGFNTANQQTTWLNDLMVAGSVVYLLGVVCVYVTLWYRKQASDARRRLYLFKRLKLRK